MYKSFVHTKIDVYDSYFYNKMIGLFDKYKNKLFIRVIRKCLNYCFTFIR